MLKRFFGRSDRGPDPAAPRAAAPDGTRLYVVGDIHGRIDLLTELHQQIHEDAYAVQAPRNVVVYVGDYIDRGIDSYGVIEMLLTQPLPGFECVHLKGNHEEAMLGFLGDTRIGPDWLGFGGLATLASYGVRPPKGGSGDSRALIRTQTELLERIPPSHVVFLRGLKPAHIEGDYIMVHAGLRPGVPIEQQSEEDMVWIREPFLKSDADFGKIVIHGHTISEKPVVRNNRIGIDTGAFHSGRLTALVIQGGEYGFLQT